MRLFIITIFFLIANSAFAQSSLVRVAKIKSVEGEAVIFSDYLKRSIPAILEERLFAGDSVMPLKEGKTAVSIDNDTLLELSDKAYITINSRWNAVQQNGIIRYHTSRIHPKSAFEVITGFGTLYSVTADFTVRDNREKSITLHQGSIELRNFDHPFHLFSSDPRCGRPINTKTSSFFLKAGEQVAFVEGYTIKTCGPFPDRPIQDDESLILFYLPSDNGFICSGGYKELDRTSDINRIIPSKQGCILKVEKSEQFCNLLARDNALYSVYRKTPYGIELELRPLYRDKEAFAQFKCR